MDKLHYNNLEECGPVLPVKINCESTFAEIKQKCCETWSLNNSIYTLYDDAFNNLDCCSLTAMNEFFNSFQPWDQLLGPGQVCFYLIEKMKNQKDLIDSQEKSIDSKSDMVEEGNNKASHQNGNDLDNCINLIKSNRILKGIEVRWSL
jgi:hypothetical protein